MGIDNHLDIIWQNVCERVDSYNDSPAGSEAFLSRTKIAEIGADSVTLTSETEYVSSCIQQFYLPVIHRAIKEMFGSTFSINLTAGKTLIHHADAQNTSPAPEPSEQESLPTIPQSETTQTLPKEPDSPHVVVNNMAYNDTAQQAAPDSYVSHANQLRFETFVIGNSNKMAYRMAIAVAQLPGSKPGLNPLFIYGKSGLGKTHLLCAIQNHINETQRGLNVVYADSAEFLDDYTGASASHDRNKYSFINFKSKYEDADVLLLDDVQSFAGKSGTLDNLFQILNNLTDRGKQVVLSADRSPKNIDVDERYRSRFSAGIVVEIQPPEIETKLGIIKSYIEEYREADPEANISLPQEFQTYIAENSSSNIRELKGALTSVIEHKMASPQFTLADVEAILKECFPSGAQKRLSIPEIQAAVETFYKVKHADLVGKRRDRNICHPRQICMYLCREMIDGITLQAIGAAFGKDHTTAIYSCGVIESELEENREVEEEIEALQRIISER